MYWFKPSKKYDPTPYSRFRHYWHKLVGCNIQGLTDITWRNGRNRGECRLTCPCGVVHIIYGNEKYDNS